MYCSSAARLTAAKLNPSPSPVAMLRALLRFMCFSSRCCHYRSNLLITRQRCLIAFCVRARRLLSLAQNIGIDGQDNDHARHDGLPFLRDRQDAQPIGEYAHDESADDGPEYRAATATERCAADNDCGYRVELVTLAERRLGGVQARSDQQTRDATDRAVQRVNDDLPPIHVHARKSY